MLHNTLRAKGAHEVSNHGMHLHSDRIAKYATHSTLCGVHAHAEPNYRKKPLVSNFQAYAPPANDPFAPFQYMTPRRHFSKTYEGFWFAGGHIAMKPGFFGWGNWKAYRWFQGWCALGIIVGYGTYFKKMYQNGWEWKNKGAVFGME